jgi:tetratricopeptide (TPR) repeat protein
MLASPSDTLVLLPRRSGSPRRWRVPPALLRNPSAPETLEGERILDEHPGDAGLLLWQCYRDVRLWAGSPPEVRSALFRPIEQETRGELAAKALRLDPEVLRAVRALQAGVRRCGDDGSMVQAALAVATASERAGAAATALAYAQLAAAAAPTTAAPALSAGRLALRLGHASVAETWLRRALALARRSADWAAYGGAVTSLGRLREGAGRLREARGEYRMALRVARRRGLYETHGRAVSGLLRIALREGDQPAAERYARSALRSHGLEHPDRGGVLLDVAEAELRRGRHARAARLLREALAALGDPDDQLRGVTLLVRAAGGAGDRATVEEAWHRALGLINSRGATADAARRLLALARAGAEVQEDAQADVAARRALGWVTRLGEMALMDECTAFLARTRAPVKANAVG